jgi:tetratricopeptide (TPR) repeat protein
LEDLHWAGSESLALLAALANIPDLPLLLVGSFRNDETPDLPEQLGKLRGLTLERLSKEAIADLSESMLGEAGRRPQILSLLERETEGNVFFLVEVVRELAEDAGQLGKVGELALPDKVQAGGVQRVIQRRLNRVPPGDHALLRLAAIAGREVDPAVLQAAKPRADVERWLWTCAEAAVLEIQDERWQFAHNKLRDGVLAGLTQDERKALHRQAAGALEKVYGAAPKTTAVLAYHWQQAGDPHKEAHYAGLAAEHALDTSAYREALGFLQRALALVKDTTGDVPAAVVQQARLKYQMGKAQVGLNAYPQAEALYKESLALARQQRAHQVSASALRGLGVVAWRHGAYGEAIERFQESLALCQEIGERRGEGLALMNLGTTYQFEEDFPLALHYYERALAIQRDIGDQISEGNTLSALGAVYRNLGELEEALACHKQALQILERTGDRQGKANTLNNLGIVAHDLRQLEDAVAYFRQALPILRDIGDLRGEESTLSNLSVAYQDLGQFQQAAGNLEAAAALAQQSGDAERLGVALDGLADCLLALGRPEEAAALYEQVLALGQDERDALGESYTLAKLARADMAQGWYEQAFERLQRAADLADESGAPEMVCLTATLQAQLYVTVGLLPPAAQRISIAYGQPLAEPNLSMLALRGVILARTGQRQAARDAFDEMLTLADSALKRTPGDYEALYSCGLAFTGLGLAASEPGDLFQMARDAYTVAHEICPAPGVVAEALQLLDLLAPLDVEGVLPLLRRVLE